jgi:hypothetical protein
MPITIKLFITCMMIYFAACLVGLSTVGNDRMQRICRFIVTIVGIAALISITTHIWTI